VKLGKFDRDRSITFIPPDGLFQLMSYRINEAINLPFKVMPVVQEIGSTKIEFSVKLKAIFDRNNFAQNVVVKIPVPAHTAQAKIFTTGAGRAKYEPDQQAVMWRIKKFQGEFEFVVSGEVLLSATKTQKTWNRPPISLEFSVPMFTSSGVRVRYLRVSEPKMDYKPTKWIRYMTKSGDYQHRI
jgi:AP-2 complex subunit mu-1